VIVVQPDVDEKLPVAPYEMVKAISRSPVFIDDGNVGVNEVPAV
jgi:hypothetical protein